MNRTLLIAAATAGLLSVALAGPGCDHDRSSKSSSSMAKPHTNAGESGSMQASGAPGIGAKHGTGVSPAGDVTGNATTGDRSTASASASSKADQASVSAPSVPAAGSDAAAKAGHGPAAIDQQNTKQDAAATAAAVRSSGADATANAAASSPAAGTAGTVIAPAAGAGPSAVAQSTPATGVAADAAQVAAADEKADHHAIAHVKPAANAPKDEQISGTVHFKPAENGLTVMVDLKGMKPNSKHGFHIHEKGDVSSPDLKSAGPHFDPGMTKHHGGAEGDMRHGGDLGNLTADADGNVKTEIMVHGVSIDGEKDGIIGRSIIVHAKADDMKSQPAGDSGDRIAGGAIEKHKHGEKSASAGTSIDAARTAAERQAGDAAASQKAAGPAVVDQQNANLNK